MSFNNEPCMISPTLLHLNLAELNYYPFMISLEECNGSCNAADNLSAKVCVPSKTKDVNAKAFNITRTYEAKILIKHISCNCKYRFNSRTCNSNQKWNNGKCQCECKNYRRCKKDYSWNPSTCFYENSRYLKDIVDDLVIVCCEIVNLAPNISTNVTNTITSKCHEYCDYCNKL